MRHPARTLLRLSAAAVFLAGAACAPGSSDETAADAQPAAAPAADSGALIPPAGEIPPGGLADWIEDVRKGLAALPARAAADPAAAQRLALDHYVGRQEYIEMFYGANGRLTAGETLGPAVMSAEEKFHDLMLLLGGSPPPDSARVQAAVDALFAEYDRVLQEAARAGVPLDPHTAANGGER
ncbi:MAG TPA: hypothetical protein VF192_11110 [Longimicrobiales bacterium]